MSAHPTLPPVQPATPAPRVSPYHLTPEARAVIARRADDIRAALHWRRAQRLAAEQLAQLQRTLQPAANQASAYPGTACVTHHWPQVQPHPQAQQRPLIRPAAPRVELQP